MAHPLVTQLRFTRSEFLRSVAGVSDEDGKLRIMPMNCLAWNIGHLAWQEQRYFHFFRTHEYILPEVQEEFAYGAPGSTPLISEILPKWRRITQAVDPWLDSLTSQALSEKVVRNGRILEALIGDLIQRTIYHYWYHNGENMAIRQQLGHQGLPVFVGNIEEEAPFRISV